MMKPRDKIRLEHMHISPASAHDFTGIHRPIHKIYVIFPQSPDVPEPQKAIMPGALPVTPWAKRVVVVVGDQLRAGSLLNKSESPRENVCPTPDPHTIWLVLLHTLK